MQSSENNASLIRPNMPELDSIRGVAIIAVLMAHGFFWFVVNQADLSKFHGLARLFILSTQGGTLGVQLFFVLSGFLITGILLDKRKNPDYYKRFYSHRALRILPAYIALLFILCIFGLAQWPFLIACVLFASNLSPLFGVVMQYGPLWTLAVEEQFYLIWPQAVRRLSEKSLVILAISIVILTPVIRLITFIKNPTQEISYYTWFVADGLALGALVAIYLRVKQTTRKKALYAGLSLAALGIGIFLIGYPFGIVHRYSSNRTIIGAIFQYTPWNILFAGIIILTLIIGTSNWKRFVLWRPLRYFGYISYGLYLIHLFIFNEFDATAQYLSPAISAIMRETMSGLILRFIIAGGFAVLVASLSRKYFESFFLRFKDREYTKKIS